MKPFGMPGIGGSLGVCSICGGPFITEILLGQKVTSFEVPGCEQQLFGHDDCIEEFAGRTFDVHDLPEASPIRQAYERNERERGVPS